jgi:sulfur-oxidizing protein SoxA
MGRPLVRAAAVLAAAAALAGAAALALEGDPLSPEDQAKATAAEKKSLEEGNRLFRDAALGTNDRTCATCHENPKRPDLGLKGVAAKYPRWDREAGKVISLHQKFQQMQEKSLKAKKAMPLGDDRWNALEMHVRGLK